MIYLYICKNQFVSDIRATSYHMTGYFYTHIQHIPQYFSSESSTQCPIKSQYKLIDMQSPLSHVKCSSEQEDARKNEISLQRI